VGFFGGTKGNQGGVVSGGWRLFTPFCNAWAVGGVIQGAAPGETKKGRRSFSSPRSDVDQNRGGCGVAGGGMPPQVSNDAPLRRYGGGLFQHLFPTSLLSRLTNSARFWNSKVDLPSFMSRSLTPSPSAPFVFVRRFALRPFFLGEDGCGDSKSLSVGPDRLPLLPAKVRPTSPSLLLKSQ